jgi:hypothetical protein
MIDFHIGNFMQILQISWALLGLVSPRYFMQILQISWALLGLVSPRYFALEIVKQGSNSLLAPYFPSFVK